MTSDKVSKRVAYIQHGSADNLPMLTECLQVRTLDDNGDNEEYVSYPIYGRKMISYAKVTNQPYIKLNGEVCRVDFGWLKV